MLSATNHLLLQGWSQDAPDRDLASHLYFYCILNFGIEVSRYFSVILDHFTNYFTWPHCWDSGACLSITYFAVAQSFWNFTQGIALILPCSLQNFAMIGPLKQMLWTNAISRDLSLRWVSDEHLIYCTASLIFVSDYYKILYMHCCCDLQNLLGTTA